VTAETTGVDRNTRRLGAGERPDPYCLVVKLSLLHRDDGIGVTLTDAVLEPGLDQVWWYKNHLEAVYCLEGEGVLEDLFTGKCYEIRPGSLYALDKHVRHRLRMTERMRVICRFVPPLAGGEVHDADGSYDAG
jgi:L-ectoine synthase